MARLYNGSMKILITGATGQLGSELQTVLAAQRAQIGPLLQEYRGAEVVAVGRSQLDIADAASVAGLIDGADFDLIVNCAAMTDVDGCEIDVEAARRGNAIGPQLLAMAAERNGCRLVHISTDYVFDGTDPRPRVESDCPDPHSVYGRSKLEGERLVAQLCQRHFIIRTAWLYGHTGRNFVKTILRLARENGAITVVDDQHGNPTNANDLAYEVLRVALGDEYGIYHCTGEGICSWFEFACAIVDIAGIECTKTPCATDRAARPAERPAYSSLDNHHLRETIVDEMLAWRDALAEYLADIS